jgi:trans-aconitate methyltransferase
MNDFSPIYKSVWLYQSTMKLLYGAEYSRKYQVVVDEIEPGSRVVDLCCGDCHIAPSLLDRNCTYLGLDASPWFVRAAQKRGLDVRLWNGKTEPIPAGDVVCLQSCLYQFIPEDLAFVRRMLASARRKIIITEPIQNVATGGSPWKRKLAEWLTRANGETFRERHSVESLRSMFQSFPPESMKKHQMKKDMLIVVSKPADPTPSFAQSEGSTVR